MVLCDSQTLTAVVVDDEGNVNGRKFLRILRDDILPICHRYPGPNSVILLDNAKIHQKPLIDALCAAHGVLVLYLPPYSPDLQPIEFVFNMTVNRMQAMYGIGQHAMSFANKLRAAFLSSCTPDQACNTFEHCGITVTAAERAWAV